VTAPADEIADDVLEIAGVVLGDDPVPLSKPARALALQAMNALGYSSPYMAEVLGVRPRTVASMASVLGVPLTRGRDFVDHVAVEFVLQGTPMALRGNDRDAALRRLAERGTTVGQCARLLRTAAHDVRELAESLQLVLVEDPDVGCWWHRYYDNTRSKIESEDR
jgi:hypothetical protein